MRAGKAVLAENWPQNAWARVLREPGRIARSLTARTTICMAQGRPSQAQMHFPSKEIGNPRDSVADELVVASLVVAGIAIAFTALNWLESRKARRLLETMVKSLPFIAKRRRGPSKKPKTSIPTVPAAPDPVKVAAEERRRVRLELEKQKLQWRQNKDIAKAIGWFLDRMNDDGEDEDDYD